MEYTKGTSPATALPSIAWALVRAARPKQWTKNLIIYLALFFTLNEAWDPSELGAFFSLLTRTTLAFGIFSAISSAMYLINDIFDIERDRQHPKKRFRPLASGQLGIFITAAVGAPLTIAGLTAAFLLEPFFGWTVLAYVATMIAYSTVLKQVILLDVYAISAGFVLRAIAGATVLQVPISPWLYICTGLGALFIALAKRRSELTTVGANAGSLRTTLDWYTPGLLDQLLTVVSTSTILAYSLYTFTASNLPENHTMMLTIPFVVYGLFRYTFLVHTKNLGEAPEDILISDVPLIVTIVLWLATSAAILVMFRG